MDREYVDLGATRDYFWFKAKFELGELLLRKFAQGHRQRILLVGAGTGAELRYLRRYGTVDILDIDKESLSRVRGKIGKKILGDIVTHRLQANHYDLAVAFDVIEHVSDDVKAMKNIHRALRPGGRMIMTVPANKFLYSNHDRHLMHRTRYSFDAIQRLFRKAGFSVLFLSFWNFFLSPMFIGYRIIGNLVEKKGVDYVTMPRPLNSTLYRILAAENSLIRKGVVLPFGISLVSVIEKHYK
jgi:SAM-dependent methyltransferase